MYNILKDFTFLFLERGEGREKHHYSCMDIPVSSHWLLGYIEVMQTVLVILTMAGLFLDSHCIDKFRTLKYYDGDA